MASSLRPPPLLSSRRPLVRPTPTEPSVLPRGLRPVLPLRQKAPIKIEPISCNDVRNQFQECLVDMNLFQKKSRWFGGKTSTLPPCTIPYSHAKCYADEEGYKIPKKEIKRAQQYTREQIRAEKKISNPSPDQIESHTHTLDFPQNLDDAYHEREVMYYKLVEKFKKIEAYFNKKIKEQIQKPIFFNQIKRFLVSFRQKIYEHNEHDVSYSIRNAKIRGYIGNYTLLIRDTSKITQQTKQMQDLLKEVEDWEYANGMEFQYISEGIR